MKRASYLKGVGRLYAELEDGPALGYWYSSTIPWDDELKAVLYKDGKICKGLYCQSISQLLKDKRVKKLKIVPSNIDEIEGRAYIFRMITTREDFCENNSPWALKV
jgi:hypothetical protein